MDDEDDDEQYNDIELEVWKLIVFLPFIYFNELCVITLWSGEQE